MSDEDLAEPRDGSGQLVQVGDRVESPGRHEGVVIHTRNVLFKHREGSVRISAPNLITVRHGDCCQGRVWSESADTWRLVERVSIWDRLRRAFLDE
jgi:hypothetical protein